mmetsp:Transcript_11140/g.12263  ORF Transcript_11140/g.12263 Transcript_11140/m.12263 type:complete len:150 (+) Transcript_11140:32-481(+)|eukprot:CAMPEP_0168529586 /NCGR_PEP_ID=MMETSP0405-20121227/14018_1 /TAXON_ID=498012 /ORGANISM="Trichosphaerium sp, Strain Am-I-7 wt" /LENGTH=149 /DNA_ID=CAMNT_0008553381 /DNA_START=87 /DNA_END=536 /DNA_ORIENTATION=+
MKTELCSFSQRRIYPGHGMTYVRTNLQLLNFQVQGSRKYVINKKKNPRFVRWTVVYRKVNKKGNYKVVKRRKVTRRMTKRERAYVGATVENMRQRKSKASKAKEDKSVLEKVKARKAEQAKRKAQLKAARQEYKAAFKRGGMKGRKDRF